MTTSIHDRAAAFDEAPGPRGDVPPSPRGVRSSAYVLRVVSDFVADLVLHQHFAEPESTSANADRGHLYFAGDDALAVAVAYAEQLDATASTAQVHVHQDGQWTGVRVAGHVRGVETWLHVVTRAKLPTYPTVDELRRHIDADRACRAMTDEQPPAEVEAPAGGEEL
jgi:hypothetical protein